MGVTLVDFLTRFYDFGIANGYFEIEQINTPDINDGEGSCCPDVEIEVINFDKTKAKIEEIDLADGKKFHAKKSCDALKFMLVEGRLDFIEYKRWQLFIDNQLKTVAEESNRKELINKKIEKFNFSDKIYDSIYLLDHLLGNGTFCITKDEKRLVERIPINYIVLVDINLKEHKAFDFIRASFIKLGMVSPNIDDEVAMEIEKELAKIKTGGKWNIQKPKLKNCKSIVAFYS